MDPVTLIVSALAAGATESLKSTASQAVRDAYGSLKSLVTSRFSGKQEAEVALVQYEASPAVWEAPLKQAIATSGINSDHQIIEAATRLLEAVDPAGQASGKYRVEFRGTAQGVVLGDHNQQ